MSQTALPFHTPARYLLVALAGGLAFGTGCVQTADRQAHENVTEDAAALDSVWSGLARAMMSGDTAAVARFYTDSAYFAETGTPTLRGRAEILAATADVFACCKYVESQVQLELSEITGDRTYQFGTYRDVIEPTGQEPIVMHGRLAAVLQRDGASAWRIDRLFVVRDSSSRAAP